MLIKPNLLKTAEVYPGIYGVHRAAEVIEGRGKEERKWGRKRERKKERMEGRRRVRKEGTERKGISRKKEQF